MLITYPILLTACKLETHILEQFQTHLVIRHYITIYLMQLEHREQVLAHTTHRLFRIAVVAVFLGDKDADTRAAVKGLKIKDIHGTDGIALPILHHQAQLPRSVYIRGGSFDELLQGKLGERHHGVAHLPHFGVVFPAVKEVHIARLKGAETDMLCFC